MAKDIIPIEHGDVEPKLLTRNTLNGYDARPETEEEGGIIVQVWRTALRRKAIFLSVFLLILVIGVVVQPSTTPVFRSEATVEIENRKVAFHSLAEPLGFYWDFDRYVSNQIEILQSRGLAKALASREDLSQWPEFNSPGNHRPSGFQAITLIWKEWTRSLFQKLGYSSPPPPKRNVQTQYKYARIQPNEATKTDALINMIRGRVFAERLNPSSSVLKVGMTAGSPERAQQLLDKYLALYLAQNTEKRNKESSDLLAWLESELKKSEERLLESEKELLDFVNKNGIIVTEGGGLGQLSEFLNRSLDSLLASRQARVKLQAQSDAQEAGMANYLPDQFKNHYVSRLKNEIASLEAKDTELNGVYSEQYPARVLLRKKMDLLKKRVATVEKKSLEQALDAASREEALLKKAVKSAKEEALQHNAMSSEFALLKKNAETARDLHRIILKEYNQMGIRARSLVNNIHVVDPPSLSAGVVAPAKRIPFLFLVPIVALLGGFAAAYGIGAMDNTIQQPEELERRFDVRRIGVVPEISRLRRSGDSGRTRGEHEFLAYEEPGSPFSNAIRNIQASLFPVGRNGESKSLLVTSPIASEGKTVISVSLATVLSCGDKRRVLLLDCDLRRPRLHKIFGHSEDEPGLTSCFTGEQSDLMKVVRNHRISGFHYLLAGPRPLDPLHLLTSERMEDLLCEMKENFDFIICDCSPILAFPDSRFLAPLTDGVMLVTSQGRVKEPELRAALELISATEGANFAGVVLNRVQACRGQSYYYYGDGRYYRNYRESC